MREIKFRGLLKNQHFKGWQYFNLLDHLAQRQDIDPETVSQFTGFIDRNGNDIYEFDIIAVEIDNEHLDINEKPSKWLKVVMFDMGTNTFSVWDEYVKSDETVLRDFFSEWDLELASFTQNEIAEYEVLGDIFTSNNLLNNNEFTWKEYYAKCK